MAAAKNATARNVSLPVLARSCRTGVGMTNTLPGPTGVLGTVFQAQLARSREDVLGLFGGIGVPAEPATGFDLVNDC